MRVLSYTPAKQSCWWKCASAISTNNQPVTVYHTKLAEGNRLVWKLSRAKDSATGRLMFCPPSAPQAFTPQPRAALSTAMISNNLK